MLKNPHFRHCRKSSPLSSLERFAFSERVSNRSALNRIYSERSDPQRRHRRQFTRRSGGSIHGDGSHQFTRRTPQFTRLWRAPSSRRRRRVADARHDEPCANERTPCSDFVKAKSRNKADAPLYAVAGAPRRIAKFFGVCYTKKGRRTLRPFFWLIVRLRITPRCSSKQGRDTWHLRPACRPQ